MELIWSVLSGSFHERLNKLPWLGARAKTLELSKALEVDGSDLGEQGSSIWLLSTAVCFGG